MPTERRLWYCDKCRQAHPSKESALECESVHVEPDPIEGDIVPISIVLISTYRDRNVGGLTITNEGLIEWAPGWPKLEGEQ